MTPQPRKAPDFHRGIMSRRRVRDRSRCYEEPGALEEALGLPFNGSSGASELQAKGSDAILSNVLCCEEVIS